MGAARGGSRAPGELALQVARRESSDGWVRRGALAPRRLQRASPTLYFHGIWCSGLLSFMVFWDTLS